MTILVQGAMDGEVDVLTEKYKPSETKTIAGYDFRIAEYKNNRIVISQTQIGIINACIATTIGIIEFAPQLAINQGCAGAHVASIKNGDLIIGESAVYMNDFHSEAKPLGKGSNSLEWRPSKRSYDVASTEKYVKIASEVAFDGTKYIGKLGSGDMMSREVDRINYLHGLFGELSEDMETAAAMRVCESFGVDRIGIRIVSNNEITNESFDYGVCSVAQKFVIAFIERVLENIDMR